MKLSERQSKTIYVMKAFALLSVFFAHMPGVGATETFRACIGLMGAPTFFILSGFVFSRPKDRRDFVVFWKKKFFSIMLPWFFWGGITFVVSVLIGNGGRRLSLISWIIGVNTWYYWLTILILCYLCFSIRDDTFICVVAIVFNVLSLLLTQNGMVKLSLPLTNYLNLFNWAGFFSLGILLKRYQTMFSKHGVWKATVVWLVVLSLFYFIPIKKDYWSLYAAILEVISAWFIYETSFLLYNFKAFQLIGKQSLLIYLIHMQPVGLINSRICFDNVWIDLITPLIAFVLISGLVVVGVKIISKTKVIWLLRLMGIRNIA